MSVAVQPRVLKGFRDSQPSAELGIRKLIQGFTTVVSRYGYLPIDTPALEYADVLLGKAGGETEKQIYRFADHGGRDIALRFDLTVPFARFMAQHHRDLPSPFRRFQAGKVWRGENTQRGRYREFTQFDADVVGVDAADLDAEILVSALRCFETVDGVTPTIHLFNRGIYNELLEQLGVTSAAVEILRAIDKVRKIGRRQVQSLISEATDETAASQIVSLLDFGGSGDPLAGFVELLGESDGVRRLRRVIELLETAGVGDRIIIDPSITRGLDYYTGIVFETFIAAASADDPASGTDLEALGSVCSGGRYDDLASLYTSSSIPGVGFSIGVDRLAAGLEDAGLLEPGEGRPEVVVFRLDESLGDTYFAIAEELRGAGMRTAVVPTTRKLGAQFGYAEQIGARIAVLVGENEVKSGTVTLKELSRRENAETSRGALVEALRRLIDG